MFGELRNAELIAFVLCFIILYVVYYSSLYSSIPGVRLFPFDHYDIALHKFLTG